MRAGELVNGYRLLEDFTVVGAGLSRWTFAERDGRQYFLKEFLSPTYPDDDAPGSSQTKARKRARCATFEAHHRRIQEALAPISHAGGNLIVTLDFFRWGAKYYKVTDKVDVAGLEPAEVAMLPLQGRLVLLKTVAHSLKILHDRGIVHGDLKPSNVLIKRTEYGHTTKLIDFDSAYLAGSPPPPDEIVGTMNYYSPELVGYIQETGVTGDQLGTAADLFALGMVYTEFLTGQLPIFDRERYRYASIAAQAGELLQVPPGDVPDPVRAVVERMLLVDPAARPAIGEVHAELLRVRTFDDAAASPATSPPSRTSRLRGRGLRITGPAIVPGVGPIAGAPGEGEEEPAPEPSRLRGRLLDRTQEPDS
jgi:eukaryotic-like serine/threonine-protein kinase